MRRTIVLTTYGNSRDLEHNDRIERLRYQLGMLVLEKRYNTYIDVSRSLLATAALAHGCDVAVFIDSDTLFETLDVEPLAEAARETRGVVGAPIDGRLSMGFTAIHREAFERLHALPQYAERLVGDGGELLRPYFQKIVVDGVWLTEDASFCHAVRSQGGRTDLDTQFQVTRRGHGARAPAEVVSPQLL